MGITRLMMIAIVFSIIFSVFNMVSIRDSKEQHNRKINRLIDLIRLGEIVRRDIPLDGLTDFEKAVTIRHYLYQNYTYGDDSGNLSFDNLSEAWQLINSQQTICQCGWMTIIYIAALESQGIPARYIGIFSSDTSPYHSHASVEFYDGNAWIVSDPTFNIMFQSGDYYLSWSDVYNGMSYTVTTNGRGEPDQWNGYYIGLDDLMKYVIIHNEPPILLPDNWDSKIDGVSMIDETWNDFYKFLHDGPLR